MADKKNSGALKLKRIHVLFLAGAICFVFYLISTFDDSEEQKLFSSKQKLSLKDALSHVPAPLKQENKAKDSVAPNQKLSTKDTKNLASLTPSETHKSTQGNILKSIEPNEVKSEIIKFEDSRKGSLTPDALIFPGALPKNDILKKVGVLRKSTSKIYAYFYKKGRKESLKIDLFFELEPDFARHLIDCSLEYRRQSPNKNLCPSSVVSFRIITKDLSDKSKTSNRTRNPEPLRYLLFFKNSNDARAIISSSNVGLEADYKIAGEVVSIYQGKENSEETLSLRFKDIRFTYILNDERTDLIMRFSPIW